MLRVPLFVLATLVLIGTTQATTLVLDSTNGYLVEIEPGATLSHVTPIAAGTFTGVVGTNIEFALGTSDVALFPGITQLGGTGAPKLGGNRVRDLVTNAVDFTILVTTSGNKYDAQLTYFNPPKPSVFGTAPSPNNAAVSVFEITAVPEPTTAGLLLVACSAGLVARRRR